MGRDEPCTRSVERLSAPADAEFIHTARDSYLFRLSLGQDEVWAGSTLGPRLPLACE